MDGQCNKLVTVAGHQLITLTFDICVQYGGRERETPRRASLSAAVETLNIMRCKLENAHWRHKNVFYLWDSTVLTPKIRCSFNATVGTSLRRNTLYDVQIVTIGPLVRVRASRRIKQTRSSAPQRDRARDRATRYVSKSVLCFTRYGILKVSDSKSDLQGHSRALAMVPFDRPHIFPISLKSQLSLSCTVSEILSLISKI